MSNPFAKYLEASIRQEVNLANKVNPRDDTTLNSYIPDLENVTTQVTNEKSFGDYVGDTTVDATKAAMTLAQTGISALDLGAYALDAVVKAPYRLAQTLAPDELEPAYATEYGQFSKLLNDNLGFNITKAKQAAGELGYSDIRKAQEAELHTGYNKEEIQAFQNTWANEFNRQYQDLEAKGADALQLSAFKTQFDGQYKKASAEFMDKYQTSMDKSFGENAAIVGKAFDTVLENPALGFGAAIESTGYLAPSLAVSRGVAALQGAAKASAASRAVAAGTGEGLVSALALNEQMRGNSETGTIDGTKVAAGFAGGAVTGLIGGASNRLGSRFGLDDVDSLGLGTQAKGFSVTRPIIATGQEGAEEFLQGFGESIIPNIAEGRDPLHGLAQELALGTVAGGIMGGATNARSLVSGAGSDLVSGFNKVAEAVGKGKDAITAKTFEELNDPTNKAYDPAKAFNSQVPKINSQDDREREEALANMDSVLTNLETHSGNLIREKVSAEGILKNIAALPTEEQGQHSKTKQQAEKLVKDLEARIIVADNQLMDLFEQKLTLGKNQEVQAGVPQYSEEQAKQDIEVLSQQPTTAVWRNQDTDLPVTVLGETQVDEAGQEYTKVSYTDATTGNVSENYVPTSELVQDTTAQQEAVDRVTRHFSNLSLEDLEALSKSPYLADAQLGALRNLTAAKRAIADMADTGTVTRHILNGLKGKTAAESHRGLNNYSDMISKGISTKDEKLLNIALNDLGRFAQDHTDKANALVEAHQLAVSGKFPTVQVLRTENGTWGIVTDPNKFIDDVKRKATGGWNVHRNSNIKGSIDAVTKEATVIQDTLKSLTQVSLSFGLQAVEPTVTTPISIEALKEANKPTGQSKPNKANTAEVSVPANLKSVFNKSLVNWDTKEFTALNAVGTQKSEYGYKNFNVSAINQQVFAEVKNIIKSGLANKNKTNDIMSRIWEEYSNNNLYLNNIGRGSFKAYIEYLKNTSSNTSPNQEVDTPTTSTQTETTEAVSTEPQLGTTTPVEAATAESITAVSTVPNRATQDKTNAAYLEFDKPVKLKDVFDSLLSITSNKHTAEERKYFNKIFSDILKAKPDALVYVVKDPALIKDSVIESGINKGGWYGVGSEIAYVYPEAAEWATDTLDALSHELIHSITHNNLVNANQAIKDSLNALQQHLSNWLIQNYAQLSDTAQDRLAYARSEDGAVEMLSVIIGEASVQKELSLVFSETQLTELRGIFKTLSTTTQEQENERNQRRSTGANQTIPTKDVSSTTEGSSRTTSRNSTDDTGDEISERNGETIPSSEAVPTTTEEVEDGKVTVLQGVTEAIREEERSKPFSARNLIKAYFTQKKGDASNSPLVLGKDFINQSNLLTQVSKYLSGKTKPTTKQLKQLIDFQRFHNQFKQNIDFIFGRKLYSSQRPQDMLVEYLQLEGRTLDENVLTAISLAAYSYLIQYGNKAVNTDDGIRNILRLEKDDVIPYQAAEMLRYAGFELPYVIKDMGKDIVKLLGLKALKDADPVLQDRLESSLGTLAFATLNDIGYLKIEHSLVDPKKLAPIMERAGYVNEAGVSPFADMNKLTFVRMNFVTDKQGKPLRDTDGEVFVPKLTVGVKRVQVSNDINEIIEASKETSGFLSKLFGLDIGYRVPTVIEPESFNQQSIRKTKSTVPKVQKDLLTEAQKTTFTMRANTVNVLSTLKGMTRDSKFLKQLLGIWIDDAVKARTNITERDSLEAKAENEWRTLNNGLDWANQTLAEDGTYNDFYDTQQVAQNQRMSYASNLFNMQGSQIHRAMASLSMYVHEISLDDTKAMSRFYQAVGEGLEGLDKQLQTIIQQSGKPYKFFTVDKVPAEDFVPALIEVLNSEVNQQAIAAMVSVMQGNIPNQEQQDAIAKFVGKGGMGVQSLQSLIALAEIAQAKDGKFTTSMGLGSDGVNNGVASANLLTGVITQGMATQTGILPNTPNTPDSMQEVYERGLTDYYVDFGNEMRTQLVEVLKKVNKDSPAVRAVLSLFKTYQEPTAQGDNNALAMRKIAKTWSVPFNYSAGKKSLQRALANGFLSGIYKEMNSIANQVLDSELRLKNKTIPLEEHTLNVARLTQEAVLLQSKLNAILGFGNRVQFTENGKLLPLNETALNQKQESILADAVTQIHGKAAWQATQKFAEEYMNIRDTYIGVTKASFELYNLVREQLIQAKLVEKRKSVADKFEREYLGLTAEELKDIDKILLPISPKLHSSLSAESTDLSAALSLTEQVDFLEEATLNRKIESSYLDRNTNTTPRITLGLNQTKETDSGVKSGALAIQSVDAYVAAYLQAQYPTLNVHDAGIFGLDYYAAATEYQNESYLNAMTTYHLGLEHAESLVRTYVGLQSFLVSMGKYGLTEEQQKDFKTKVKAKLKELTFGIADSTGKVTTKGLKQYLEKQGVEAPTSIVDAIKKVITLSSNQDKAKLDVLENTKAVHQYSGEDGVYSVPKEFKGEVAKQRKKVDTRAKAATKALTGKAVELADDGSSLLGYLEANKDKELTAQEVMKALNTRDKASKSSMLNKQEEAVLTELESLVSQEVKVIYADGDYKGYGYFDEATNTIYIKAKGSEGSKVNSHLLIHELLHSALAMRIATLKANPNSNKEAKQALDRLEALRLEILGKVDPKSTVAKMLKNVDEFISYGLTDQRLQEALQQITVERNGRSSKDLNTRWRTFVLSVMKLIGFNTGKNLDAMAAFAMDTANLLKSIQEVTPTKSGGKHYSEYDFEDQVNQMSSIEVMQALPHTGNSDFGLHLNSLAESVIGQLYNNDDVAKAQIDVMQAAQVLPAIKAGFNLSQREAAVQRSLELVLETFLETSKGGLNAGQLWKIYTEAQKNIKVDSFYDGDWSKATPQERRATEQKFNYVMNSSGKGVESLARFISMGLATEEVHNLLGFNTVTNKPSKQKTWFDTFNAWLRYVFAWVGGKLVKTSASDPAYKQLQKLVNNLTALDIRNRQDVVAIYEKAWNLLGKVTAPLDSAAQSLRQYATNRDFLRKSKYLPLRTLGSIASLDAKAMGETIPALIRETRDKARPNEKLGEAMTALMESTAMTAIRKAMESLIRQANLNAKERQDRTDNVKKAIMSWFKDNGKSLSKEMHKAITYTLLRTDAQSLLTTFGLDKTIGLLLDTNKLKTEIDLVTKNISQYKNGVDMIHAAEDLGYYMISNKGGLGLNKNPTKIAMGLGTNYQIALEDVDQALVGQLDVLASLFAMKYTSAKDRKLLGEMYKENPEALQGLLNMHKGFMTDAETEFKDNPLNYVKGWMPEIVNPYREVRAASGTVERDQMIKEGWKVIEELKPHDKFLMVHYDIGYQRLVSGAVDLQNSHRKGTEIIDRQSKQYLAAVKANLAYTAHRASIPLGQYDPTKKPTGLIPAYDTDGVPLGFNYEMASWVRDKEMERNNNFADLMGSYAGAMYYKPAKRNQSVTVANVLFEDFKQNYQKSPNSYIKLSGKSSDPRIVEMWRMLPKDFRQRATELYGKGEPIIINNEAFLLAFGFKKWTITNIWNKQPNERTHMETMFVQMADGILGDTAKAKIAKAGHIWTEAVSKAKDFIVIRSISVLWHNVLSNGLMLMAYGINPITIAKEWTFATANVRAYQTLHSELIQLKANTLAGKGNSATETQIKRIESQLEANPMHRYINEGLLSSIVEDVTIQQGDYTYDSELKKKIDSVTGWMPDSVKTLGAWAVLSPSTQGYQFLATTTQLSDFVAKVTLAKHLESKGMDFKLAISEASQTFINYDVPQGVGMQYMNDMGLFMFTKFFLRIQAVLFKLLDRKAATVLAQHIAVESLTDMQGLLSPSVFGSIGNWPLEEGAASIVGAAMSIAPVNAGLGLAGF